MEKSENFKISHKWAAIGENRLIQASYLGKE
jgi:hypothetical protein